MVPSRVPVASHVMLAFEPVVVQLPPAPPDVDAYQLPVVGVVPAAPSAPPAPPVLPLTPTGATLLTNM